MIRKTNILTLAIIISCSAFGQDFNSGITQNDFYTEFNYEWINEKIIIPVEIEGIIYRFILDTGAPVVISSDLRDKISTNHISKSLIADAHSQTDSLELVTIPLIKIGNVYYENIPSLVSNNFSDTILDCLNADGFIGSNLLRNSIIQILPKENLVRLTDNKRRLSLRRKYSTKLRFPDNQSTPFFWVHFNANKKGNEEVYFDTGMDGLYDLSKEHFTYFQEKGIFNIKAKSIGTASVGAFGAEDSTIIFQIEISELIINKTAFKNVTIETTNSVNSRIGSEILNYGNITVDYINKRLYFEPFEDSIDMKEKTFGFKPVFFEGKVIIGIVWDDNLKDKLNYGQQIVQINEIDLTNYNLCDYIDLDLSKYEELELIVIDSQGEKSKIKIEKSYR